MHLDPNGHRVTDPSDWKGEPGAPPWVAITVAPLVVIFFAWLILG